jgi:predicted alpha-1,2-mannosidase
VPYDHNGSSASLTLEYAYDDWTIYQTALKLSDTQLADIYKKRSQSWRNTFDSSIGFARPRYSDGTWKQPFSLLNTDDEGFIEGNSWNYSFYVPHDVEGLIEAMGGEQQFIANLDSIFVMKLPAEFFENTEDVTEEGLMGNYVHGNEPSHHIAYLYNWTSQPYKTQYWVHEIMNRMYKNNIDGLCGNDDCGQMSAWYIFSAMGFYPVCPGSDKYMFGAPYLPYMKVRLGNGKTLEIKAPNISDENRYVSKITLNGKEITNRYITHEELMQGGVLEFEMTESKSK